jgi:hypothetical protein
MALPDGISFRYDGPSAFSGDAVIAALRAENRLLRGENAALRELERRLGDRPEPGGSARRLSGGAQGERDYQCSGDIPALFSPQVLDGLACDSDLNHAFRSKRSWSDQYV